MVKGCGFAGNLILLDFVEGTADDLCCLTYDFKKFLNLLGSTISMSYGEDCLIVFVVGICCDGGGS